MRSVQKFRTKIELLEPELEKLFPEELMAVRRFYFENVEANKDEKRK